MKIKTEDSVKLRHILEIIAIGTEAINDLEKVYNLINDCSEEDVLFFKKKEDCLKAIIKAIKLTVEDESQEEK